MSVHRQQTTSSMHLTTQVVAYESSSLSEPASPYSATLPYLLPTWLQTTTSLTKGSSSTRLETVKGSLNIRCSFTICKVVMISMGKKFSLVLQSLSTEYLLVFKCNCEGILMNIFDKSLKQKHRLRMHLNSFKHWQ